MDHVVKLAVGPVHSDPIVEMNVIQGWMLFTFSMMFTALITQQTPRDNEPSNRWWSQQQKGSNLGLFSNSTSYIVSIFDMTWCDPATLLRHRTWDPRSLWKPPWFRWLLAMRMTRTGRHEATLPCVLGYSMPGKSGILQVRLQQS